MTDLHQDSSASAHELAPQVDQILASGRTSLHRFPQPLETAYQRYAASVKSRQAMRAAIACLIIFNLGIFMDYAARPDLLWEFLLLRCVFATLPCLFLVWLSSRVSAVALRDWIAGASLIWISFGVNILVAMRGVPPGYIAFSVAILIIVTNIVFHLRTTVAICVSIAVMLVTAGFLSSRLEGPSPQDALAILFVAVTAVVTLLANFRLECTMRHLYLMILREQIRTGDMQRANQELTAMSLTDPLTGIANRRLFDKQFETACSTACDGRATLGLLLVDVDHFKRYNDTHGHLAGDACLKQVATTIAQQVRRERDLPARIGGEEFAVLLRETTEEGARKVAERIHSALAVCWPEGLAPVTVSIGLAIMRCPAAQAIMAAADKALYEAKDRGRNCTIITATAA
ncbi:GGDEF domain-containing protein [Rhizobium sp. SL86]|uniref:GGDEF domain-containing protein n=1 Tax=Rhizobium sp. SL86 TaxID=2995148 RepID=UPI0022724048|nr:GGDEF domain-containing protein [Rhizobium sp. SL86]MCY1669091.1 GGDEF domain-containing protein [Rhizobium sp. SL86]